MRDVEFVRLFGGKVHVVARTDNTTGNRPTAPDDADNLIAFLTGAVTTRCGRTIRRHDENGPETRGALVWTFSDADLCGGCHRATPPDQQGALFEHPVPVDVVIDFDSTDGFDRLAADTLLNERLTDLRAFGAVEAYWLTHQDPAAVLAAADQAGIPSGLPWPVLSLSGDSSAHNRFDCVKDLRTRTGNRLAWVGPTAGDDRSSDWAAALGDVLLIQSSRTEGFSQQILRRVEDWVVVGRP